MNLREMSAQEVETLRGGCSPATQDRSRSSTTLGSAPVCGHSRSPTGVRRGWAARSATTSPFLTGAHGLHRPRSEHRRASRRAPRRRDLRFRQDDLVHDEPASARSCSGRALPTKGMLQHRLIGSAFGPSFEHDGKPIHRAALVGASSPKTRSGWNRLVGPEAQSLARTCLSGTSTVTRLGPASSFSIPCSAATIERRMRAPWWSPPCGTSGRNWSRRPRGATRMRISVELNGVPAADSRHHHPPYPLGLR